MQGNNELNYQIIMSKRIVGEGKIDDIKKRILNKKFELLSDKDESFEVDLKFSSPSIVTKIQLKLIRTYRYSLRLMNSKNRLVQQFNEFVTDRDGRVTLSPKNVEPVSIAKLRIQNDPFQSKRIGINYVIFNGFSDEKPQINKKSNIKNKSPIQSSNEQIKLQSNSKNDPKRIDSKVFFDTRQKQKSVKADVQRLLGLQQYGFKQASIQEQKRIEQKLRKKVKLSQSKQKSNKKAIKDEIDSKLKYKEDTDLAIALSKSEHHQMEVESSYQEMEIEELKKQNELIPAQLQNYIENILYLPDRRYQTVEFNEEYISYFSDLNPNWLEAQRKAEIQAQVREQEKLSKYIQLKFLIETEVYISDFPEWKIEELKHQAKQLGCRVISQLKNHILAVVPKSVCQKLRKKHKSWNQIKYISPQYFEDCIKNQAKLAFHDYYLKV